MMRITAGGALAALTASAAMAGLSPLTARAQPYAEPPPAPAAPSPLPALRQDQAEALLKMLAEAPSHGFGAGEFPVEGLRSGVRDGDPATLARLRDLSIAYARAQHGLRLPASEFDHNWGLHPAPYDARADLDQALRSDRIPAWIASQPPPFARYRTLRDGLTIYGRLAAQGGWGSVPAGPELQLGDTGARVKALRARLSYEDGLLARTPTSAPFDDQLKASLQHFQERHGLAADGVVEAKTLAALNVSARARADQIRANMERWRWLPRDWPVDRLEVNIASATLDVYQDGRLTDHMLAAAGRPTDQTPILESTVRSIVLNPAWHVPNSIATKELLPKGEAYLRRAGYTINPPGEGVRLVQKPGPTNALGQVKFDFANDYGVYLHDTNSRSAFGRAGRSVSHGCVRLQRPISLAKRLLDGSPEWTPDHVDAVLDTADTTRAQLPKPYAVLLMYWTAFPDGAQLAFRDDVYGWDAKLLGLLAAGGPA